MYIIDENKKICVSLEMGKQASGRNVSSSENTDFQGQKKEKKRSFRKKQNKKKKTLKKSNPELKKQIENHV